MWKLGGNPESTPVPSQQNLWDTPVRLLCHSVTNYRPLRANDYERVNNVSSTHQKGNPRGNDAVSTTRKHVSMDGPERKKYARKSHDAPYAKLPYVMIALAVEVALAVPASALSPLALRLLASEILACALQARSR